MREAKLPSDRRAVFYLLFLLCLLVPGAVFAGDDGAEASTDDEESSDGDTEVEEVDEDSEGEPRADYGGAATSRDEAVDSAAAGPEEGWDLSRQELAELEALEALEAADGLASSHRIKMLRRKRARRAKRVIQSVAGVPLHRQLSVGVRGTGLASLRKGRPTIGLGGVGGFVEVSAVHGELELELAGRVLFEEGKLQIPVELLFKKPWDRGPFRFFMGVGPAAIFGVTLADEHAGEDAQAAEAGPSGIHFGFSGVAGLTWWMRPRLGLNAELNYNIVIDHGASHELGASLGVVFAL